MKEIKITIEVDSDVEAYKLVNHLSWEHKVTKANYNGKICQFSKTNIAKDFLKKETKK